MEPQYILYGSYASYFTAKTRAYLRKKSIPFIERHVGDPQFRSLIQPQTGSHRIPQLYCMLNGDCVQDSTNILDYLEKRHPKLPAIPPTPCQRIFVHLMELYASEGLLKLAYAYRWLFIDNMEFITKDFGMALRPQGNTEILNKYGGRIVNRMEGGKNIMLRSVKKTEDVMDDTDLRKDLNKAYLKLLKLFDDHLLLMPYLLGGHPSAADYAMMAALHAHLGRDPVPLRLMQVNAPHVFRWVEHMLNFAEVQSPEFFDYPVEFEKNDIVPPSALKILKFIAVDQQRMFKDDYVKEVIAFEEEMELHPEKRGNGNPLLDGNDKGADQAILIVDRDGGKKKMGISLHHVWLSQRSREFFQTSSISDQNKIITMLGEDNDSLDLLKVPIRTKIKRVILKEPNRPRFIAEEWDNNQNINKSKL